MLSIEDFKNQIFSRYELKFDSYEPEINDLYFLYTTVVEKSVVSVLEYGSGWSTLALSLALLENEKIFGKSHRISIRHPNPFQILTLDASKHWQDIAIKRLNAEERKLVTPVVVTPEISRFADGICHLNNLIPNFSPDLVYLDGPDHDQIVGEINGFKYDERFTPPMHADLLMLEPFFWPETLIISDGRTANARFLEGRFKRNWQVLHDPFGDRTIFRLNETPFGEISLQHINFRLEQSKIAQSKENPSR
jgi:hypothetical protein